MVGFAKLKAELDELGIRVVAASTDPLEKAKEVASEVNFPIGYGVSREMAASLGAWWEERRGIIQPAEFVIDAEGVVVSSSYSDGPIGRMDAVDVIRMIQHRDRHASR